MTAAPMRRRQVFYDGELAEFMQLIVRGIYEEVAARVDAKISALEIRLAWAEAAAAEFTFKGTWAADRVYKRGNVCSLGSVWFCNRDGATSKPGADNGDWSLMLARPRDGRDAPLPGAPRTVRAAARAGDTLVRRR